VKTRTTKSSEGAWAEKVQKMWVRPETQGVPKVQASELPVLQRPNDPVYLGPQILVLLHSSFNLLVKKNSIIIRGWLSRIERLQEEEETSIMNPLLKLQSFKPSLL